MIDCRKTQTEGGYKPRTVAENDDKALKGVASVRVAVEGWPKSYMTGRSKFKDLKADRQ